jgi:predicted DsbA family dithiol-disulfide isomerase
VYRLHRFRSSLDLEGRVRFDMRAFPLELLNSQPTPKHTLDAEIPVVGALEPDAGWQVWQRPDHEYPATMTPALEAVQAAKEQGLDASEGLDRALRVAFFSESRPISLRHEILAAAKDIDGLDVERLAEALDEGRHRSVISEHWEVASSNAVQGSPHLFLPDGTNVHNPGIEMHWEGEHGKGFPVVTRDDPSIYEDLLRRAARWRGASL